MTFKPLVTRLLTGGVAAAAVAAAAAGAIPAGWLAAPGVPSVTPVVFGAPLPQEPAPDLAAPLASTLNALAGGGSFGGAKAAYIQGGIGRIEALTADRAYNNAAAKGYFPLTFSVADVDQEAGVATANVTATAATGVTATQPVTFVAGPSPTGWQISKGSALSLLSSVG